MTETQIDIAEIKQTLKNIQEDVELLKKQQRKEDVYFNTWLDQYNNKGETFYATMYPDVTTKPFDWNEVPPTIPTQACSNEDIERANKKWSEFISKHPEYK